MQLISGFDMPRPSVGGEYKFQAEWTQHTQDGVWQADFDLALACGLDWIRYGWPWSLLEPSEGNYDFSELDARFAYAEKIGLGIGLTVTHFSFPDWLQGENGEHATLAPELGIHLARLTDELMKRYKPVLVVPIVEMAMEAFRRALAGSWKPHYVDRTDIYAEMWRNLNEAFKASAEVIRAHGGRVMVCEPVTEVELLAPLQPWFDVTGLDYYPHFHAEVPLVTYFEKAHELLKRPIVLAEFGVPEGYKGSLDDIDYDGPGPGQDTTRARLAHDLYGFLAESQKKGLNIEAAGWYPFIDNFWHEALTKKPEGDGDRAGMIDFRSRADGVLERVPCTELVEVLKKIKGL